MTRIAVIGAGGVGAETLLELKRASIKADIHIIDRDFVDADTLKRQTLFQQADVGRLKAMAAAEKLGKKFTAISEHLSGGNADALLKGATVVLDCTDNWATRCVINTWALQHQKPWIFTSAIRSQTMTTTVTSETACFVCWNPTPATPRSCRLEGIEKETTAMAAQTQTAELVAVLAKRPRLAGKLQLTDVQSKACTIKALSKNPECPACVKKTFHLPEQRTVTLCGDGEYLFQLDGAVDFKSFESFKPKKFGDVLKIKWKTAELVVFQSGRVLARGMTERHAKAAVDAIRQKMDS